MTTIAELGIRVDSGDAAHAATDLDKLVEAGGRAEKAAAGVEQSAKKAGQALRGQADDLGQLLGEIDPTVKALGRLDDLESRLAKQKKFLDPEIFSEYQGKIHQSREALTRFDDSLTRTGNTAKQNAAALRGVPAQFTDIFVSLQGGQAPLTVLLQQGGQLKDMFGGIAPAAKALGGYVLGLVNPLTVAAAAAGALALAYYKGSQEADEYNKAIIFTGNAAGTSADQLASMAQQVSATVGTTGAAAEVLAKLAGSGKIASGSFEAITEAALSMEKATGRSIDETVAEFAKIAKDPVAAAKELNDQYNFLTASVYSQIVALKEQGDTIGAAKLLTDTYADTIRTRTREVTENLGLIESAWKGIKSAAADALDATLSVGRTRSIDEQIANYQQIIDDRKTSLTAKVFSGALGPESGSTRFIEAQISALKREKAQIEANTKAQSEAVQVQNDAQDAQRRVDAATKTSLTNDQRRNKLLEDYREDLEKIRKANPADARLAADVIARNIQNIKDKNKDPRVATTPVDLTGFNSSKNSLTAILSEYKNYQKELDAAQKAGIISQESYAAQREAIIEQQKGEVTNAYQAEITALEAVKGKASTSAAQRIQLDQKIADARANMVKAQKDADSELAVLAINEKGRLDKQTQAVQTYTSALEQQVNALRLQGVRSAEGLGLGDRQRSLQDQQNGITDRINQQKLDLANQYGDGSRGMSLDEYNQKLAVLDKTQRDLQQTAITNYNDMTDAQGSWSAGASSAFQNYLESARDVAGQTKSLFTNAFSSMEDAVVNFAMTGKFSFADFTKSILADMARIATRQAASGLLSSIAGTALGAWFGGGAAPASTTASVGGSTTTFNPQLDTSGLTYQAKGGAWSEGVQFFANGGAFTNSIVSQPTAFSMADGKTGVMGEAGEGAIMPLARTSGGQLGVRAIGGGGGGGGTAISISAPVSLTIPDRSDEGMELDQTLLQQNMQKQMRIAADKAVADSWRPGGVSYRNSQGRT